MSKSRLFAQSLVGLSFFLWDLSCNGQIKIEPTKEQETRAILNAMPKVSFYDLHQTFQVVQQNSVFADYLRLTKEQRQAIEKAFANYEQNLKAMESEIIPVSDAIALEQYQKRIHENKQKFREAITEVLLPNQLEEVVQFRGSRRSLMGSLLSSPAGDFVELSDSQRKKIKQESDRLCKEMEEYLSRKRAQSKRIWFENLTQEQIEKFEKIRRFKLRKYLDDVGFDQILRAHKVEHEAKK